ncbi:MAG: heavy-metal-associated domain-containing protein [Pseudomonadales bacterium]
MRRWLVVLSTALLVSVDAFAADTQYTMRVDGLACPYCAYGIEKKLKKIEGARDIVIDLNTGVVRVTVPEGTELTESFMKKLFNDAGFTYRSMQVKSL